MKLKDLRVGMKVKSLGDGKIETIRKVDEFMGAIVTERNIYWSFKYNKDWTFYVPEFDGPQDAATHLKAEDYHSLLEIAVEMDDKAWFEEICAVINQGGEQLA